ncbi:hypothetical protein QOT17_020907 [Balamuthia mandrillaris]
MTPVRQWLLRGVAAGGSLWLVYLAHPATTTTRWPRASLNLRYLNFRHMNVTYEELTTNTRKELCRAIRFLGCDCALIQDTPPDIQKLHPKPKSSYFANWDEVVEVLKDTHYAWMLNA